MSDDEAQRISLRIPKPELRKLLTFDQELRKVKGIGILTPEARVLFSIACNGAAPVGEIRAVAGTSYRGFYTVLQRLRDAELLSSAADTGDQRVRRLHIDRDMENEITS